MKIGWPQLLEKLRQGSIVLFDANVCPHFEISAVIYMHCIQGSNKPVKIVLFDVKVCPRFKISAVIHCTQGGQKPAKN